MSRRRPSSHRGPEQLPLPAPPSKPLTPAVPSPEEVARVAVRRRAKPSAVPGHVKLTFTLDAERSLAEWLSAHAIHEGVNAEALIVELLRVARAE